MNKKRITYAILPFLLVALLLGITYFGNQWYAEAMDIEGVDYSYIFLHFNQAVPFIDWTIYPYIIAYPFWMYAFFVIGYYNKDNLYKILAMVIVTFIVCGLWYFFFQSDVESWRLTSGLFLNNEYLTPRPDLNFSEKLVVWIYKAAGPRNALPSMHVLMSWLAIIGLRLDKKIALGHRIAIWVISLAIIISTQTLKQHYIIDLIVAIALAEAAYWIFRNSKFPRWLEDKFTRINRRYNLDWDGKTE